MNFNTHKENLAITNKKAELNSTRSNIIFTLFINLLIRRGFNLRPSNIPNGTIPERTKESDSFDIKTFEYDLVLTNFCYTPIRVFIKVFGDVLLMNFLVDASENEVYSITIPMSKYFTSPVEETLLTNWNELIKIYRNTIICPLKSKIANINGYPGGSLEGLPHDIIKHIILYLPVCDILSLSRTCRTMSVACFDQTTWKQLFKRDKRRLQHPEVTDVVDWIECYKTSRRPDEPNHSVYRNRKYHNFNYYLDLFSPDDIYFDYQERAGVRLISNMYHPDIFLS